MKEKSKNIEKTKGKWRKIKEMKENRKTQTNQTKKQNLKKNSKP